MALIAGVDIHPRTHGAWVLDRLPQIWGTDANEFNPLRFIEHEKMGETYVGVTSNLMSFSAGPQACIGWRFA